jgi:phosphonopyruvate decarboxylase
MDAALFLTLLEKNGFNYFTGVPCSYLEPLIKILDKRAKQFHTTALREDIAAGLATGAFLGGRLPVIYMQNSGLGYSLEAFASLHLIYHIPSLVLVSYRGPKDKGWEEHLIMGKNTENLLKTFNLKYSIIKKDISADEIKSIKKYVCSKKLPWFLLIDKGALQ